MTDTDPRTQAALTVSCPDCLAPAGRPCGEQTHADRLRIVDLRALTRGTCALCHQPMVRGSLDGAPTDAWHPDPADAAACPRIPDPAQDWEAYATAVNLGLTPGHPGAEHFVPNDEQHEVTAGEVTTLTGTATPGALQDLAQDLVDAGHAPDRATAGALLHQSLPEPVVKPLTTHGPRPVYCPECIAGKHPNCVGQALDPVTDDLVPCTCNHGGPL